MSDDENRVLRDQIPWQLHCRVEQALARFEDVSSFGDFNPTGLDPPQTPIEHENDIAGEMLDRNTSLARAWQNTRLDYINELESSPILIAQFSYCDGSGCAMAGKRHLLIQFDHVPKDHRFGAAISYTWGEFCRQRVVIGHDSSGCLRALQLGQEWDVEDLLACLVNLSAEYGGCWIDQLCINQDPSELRRSLCNIPYIFRTLDVIALVPGSTCSCLRENENFITREAVSRRTLEEIETLREQTSIRKFNCLNAAGLSSWFERLWTWQELMYSQRITLKRTSNTILPCVKSEDDIGFLGEYGRLLFERNTRNGHSRENSFRAVKMANRLFFSNAIDAMMAYCAYGHQSAGDYVDASLTLSRFLLGETIENQLPYDARKDVHGRLRSFLYYLGKLSTSSRKVTSDWDYIVSVWDLPSLLEDAILQLEQKLGVSPASNAPAGLFGNAEAGGLWRPTSYLSSSGYRDSRDLYSVLNEHHEIPVFEGSIPLISLGENLMSLSARSFDYISTFRGWKTSDVIPILQNVVDQFPVATLARLVRLYLSCNTSEPGTTPDSAKVAQHVISKAMFGGRADEENLIPELHDVDHYATMYKIVTDALGLDISFCQRQQLILMISLEYPPCVGLVVPKFDDQGLMLALEEWMQESHVYGHMNGTICVARGPKRIGCSLLEASFVQAGPPPLMEVSGIWVPMRHTALHDIQAMAQSFGRDGRLGGRLRVEQMVSHHSAIANVSRSSGSDIQPYQLEDKTDKVGRKLDVIANSSQQSIQSPRTRRFPRSLSSLCFLAFFVSLLLALRVRCITTAPL